MSAHEELIAAEARLAELEIQRADALSRVAKLRAVLEIDEQFGQAEKLRLFGNRGSGRPRLKRRGQALPGADSEVPRIAF